MQAKHVKVTIRVDGTCSIDAINFPDASCTQVTNQIMSALGGVKVQERYKPEAALSIRQPQIQSELAR